MQVQDQPPPPAPPILKRLFRNLFGSPIDALITIALIFLGVQLGQSLLNWAIIEATWVGNDSSACATRDGACWAFIAARWEQIIYGLYPAGERWRVDLSLIAGGISLVVLVWPWRIRQTIWSVGVLAIYPPMCWLLLRGGIFGIEVVETRLWGGLTLTLVVAAVGIMSSIPIGLVLALGRRSRLPALSAFCAGFIEFWRGVPLLAVLFVAVVMFPFFTPPGVELNLLVRVLVAFSLYKSAYIAEVLRGGLQMIPKGQLEAARALCLGRWRTFFSVVLPQVVHHVRPALANIYILTVKETTVVVVIGLADVTGVIQHGLSDSHWLGGGNIAATGYVFLAIVFWCFTFAISRWSAYMEDRDSWAEAARTANKKPEANTGE